MADETTTMLCAPAFGFAAPIEGSVRRVCADCAQAIWLSPSGQKLSGPETVLVCTACGISRITHDPEAEIATPTNEQLAEIHRHFRKDYDDA